MSLAHSSQTPCNPENSWVLKRARLPKAQEKAKDNAIVQQENTEQTLRSPSFLGNVMLEILQLIREMHGAGSQFLTPSIKSTGKAPHHYVQAPLHSQSTNFMPW